MTGNKTIRSLLLRCNQTFRGILREAAAPPIPSAKARNSIAKRNLAGSVRGAGNRTRSFAGKRSVANECEDDRFAGVFFGLVAVWTDRTGLFRRGRHALPRAVDGYPCRRCVAMAAATRVTAALSRPPVAA